MRCAHLVPAALLILGCGDKDGGTVGESGGEGGEGSGSDVGGGSGGEVGGGDDGSGEGDDGGGDSGVGDSGGDDTGLSGACEPVLGPSGAVEAEAGLSPEQHDFGTVLLGCPSTTRVVVENRGEGPLEVAAFELGSEQHLVEATADSGELPVALGAGEAWCADVSFLPETPGSSSVSLRVSTDDPLRPLLVSSLVGEGESVGTAEDVHTGDGSTSTFPLSQQPAGERVAVSLDGTDTPWGWRYDPDENAVIFEEAEAVPDAGVEVLLGYFLSGC